MATTNEQISEKIGHLNGSMESVLRSIAATEQQAAARSEKIFEKLEEASQDISTLKQQVSEIHHKIDNTIMPAVDEFNRMKWKGTGALAAAGLVGGLIIGNLGSLVKYVSTMFNPS